MRIRSSSKAVCVRAVTSLGWWGAASSLVGGLSAGCSDTAELPRAAQDRNADRALEQLQRVSPLQPSTSVVAAPVVAGPVAAGPVAAEGVLTEAPAAELLLADAGVSAPSASEDAPTDAMDAGPEEVAPTAAEGASPDAGAPVLPPTLPPFDPVVEIPRDIVAQSALPLHALVKGELLSEAELWQLLAQKPVTCFGELHDRPQDHYAETRVLAELVARTKRGASEGAPPAAGAAPLALGMEMFQRPFQAPLTAFVQGQLDEAGLIAATEYETRWGYDFSFYRPLLEAARSERLPTLALNAPRELTRKIGRTGLASLDDSERAQLPELNLEDAEHREFIFTLLGALDHELQLQLENVYVAQTVWDETMAESSATWLAGAGPDARLLILAGAAHCHQSAIPRRLERRFASAGGLEVTSLAVALASELSTPGFSAVGYDVLVLLEDVPLPPDLLDAEIPGAE